MFVAPADATPTAGGDDTVRREFLDALEFLLLLWISHLNAVRVGVRVPHGGICRG